MQVVYPYDDELSIIDRHALTHKSSSSYYRIETIDFNIAKDTHLIIRDIRDDLRKIKIDELLNEIRNLKGLYNISTKDIVIVWILVNNFVVGDKLTVPFDIIHKVDKKLFSTEAKLVSMIKEYTDRLPKELEQLKDRVEYSNKLFIQLSKVQGHVQTSELTIESISLCIFVSLPHQEVLIDIFDSLDASVYIPILILVQGTKRYYKLYSDMEISEEWLTEQYSEDGIYFRILSSDRSKISSRYHLENIYPKGRWMEDNRIFVDMYLGLGIDEKIITSYILDSLGDRVRYKVDQITQLDIRSYFTITEGINLSRVVLAELITNDDLVSKFLFIDERVKTITEKEKLFVKYSIRSLTLLFTPTENLGLVVRITGNVKTFNQANSFRYVLSKLLEYYKIRKPLIEEEYALIIPIKEQITKTKTKVKEDRKTGKRAKNLERSRPNLFPSRYPDQCQSRRQPYLVVGTKEDVTAKVSESIINNGGNWDEHKIINYPLGTEDWYACEPREDADVEKTHLWPGLQKPSKKMKEWSMLPPCCFTTDQYEKTASEWRKYLEKSEETYEESSEEERAEGTGLGFVKSSDKALLEGRYGEMPFLWRKILDMIGTSKFTKSSKEYHTILRYGVQRSPDSFFHCILKAFEPIYTGAPPKERARMVRKLRKELSKEIENYKNHPSFVSQNYDKTVGELKDILEDDRVYIDPRIFVGLMEARYRSKIYMYIQVDDNVDVYLPRYSQAELLRVPTEYNNAVLILVMNITNEAYPYQCELVSKLSFGERETSFSYTFSKDSKISKVAWSLLRDSNDVYILSEEGMKYYKPVSYNV